MPFTILSGVKRKELPYEFQILTLSPDDPAEHLFIDMLLKSEPDLYEHTDEPMVFPVFGRGRALGCLFGEYITGKNIQEASAFLSGACSCEVKKLNPGIDLLVAAPWDMVVINSFVQDAPLPELTGVMPVKTVLEKPTTATPALEEPADSTPVVGVPVPEIEKGDSRILKVYGITLSSILIVVILAGFFLNHRREKHS
jgi:hypothetical protein